MMADIRFFLEIGRRSLGKDEALDIGLSRSVKDLGRFSGANVPTSSFPRRRESRVARAVPVETIHIAADAALTLDSRLRGNDALSAKSRPFQSTGGSDRRCAK